MSWVIEKFENGKAFLKNGETSFGVPHAQMPDEAKEGDNISADFYFTKDEKKRRDNLARALLEEIVGKS